MIQNKSKTELKPAPYYNNPQLVIKLGLQPHKMFIGGRGVGKTTIIADELIKYLQDHEEDVKYSLDKT